jgi:2-oxoglutarate dehydrogenase E1 component
MGIQENLKDILLQSSHLAPENIDYVEALYEDWRNDANSVSGEWSSFFEALPTPTVPNYRELSHLQMVEQFRGLPRRGSYQAVNEESCTPSLLHQAKQVNVVQLITAYRVRGHQMAAIDPLHLLQREEVGDLRIEYHGLATGDFETIFATLPLAITQQAMKLNELVRLLDDIYCTSIGYEYMHIINLHEREWLQQRIESVGGKPTFDASTRLHLLERLSAAEGLEKHLDAKYPGTKRFSLEGGEVLIPALDDLIQRAGANGFKEIVIGMAHRGRLNVLVNTLGKNPSILFDEFEGRASYNNSGDVKYHQGFSSNIMTTGGEVHCSMAFNPSHLEIVGPVVEGSVRARQDRRQDKHGDLVLPIIIHGDASVAGQGVVMETFQMSQTRAYSTGGTVHIVLNNQVGFTTSRPEDARSTEYCTDIAKMVAAPIFHVNGDDPEAVLFVTQLALDFRNTFHKDVVVDIVCYRRRGHNETDEPSATQPVMYKAIRALQSSRSLYAEKLVNAGLLSMPEAEEMSSSYRTALNNGTHVVKSLVMAPNTALYVDWRPYIGGEWDMPCDTSIDMHHLKDLAQKINAIPEGFTVNRQVAKVLEDRGRMARGEQNLDWGCAELLAYASLVDNNYKVRITGQDVGRGTFSHRHAVVHEQNTGKNYVPLTKISESQRKFVLYDSFLSEEAVLAFEYGYATTRPDALVIWEAQFGDFANGAQVVIDQFIASGEFKWERLCGLTMLLPHGYEGQGPEHSSARLERFLQLCAQRNIQVCIPTTPAQIFHLLRRQVMRPLRKPLVVMSPKSLLRHKEAVSSLEELASGSFHMVLPETDTLDPKAVKRLILCSGKVYYELRARRRDLELDEAAIVRIEQLYPFPHEVLNEIVAPYTNLEHLVWCQEEPQNMGAWYSSQHHMKIVGRKLNPDLVLTYAGREASASPAAGYGALHNREQQQLINDAFGIA